MPTINANIADYLLQIENLTNTNLQILKTLNDSFLTKKTHLFAEIDDATYIIPSFISLENKINMLQENFENLVHAPETCEAYFNFDGNTRAIEVRKYNHTPDSVTLPTVSNYNFKSNDVFKDFLNPVPYINLELPSLPNDIVEVNVKKVIPTNTTLKNTFGAKLQESASVNMTYADMYKLLADYKKDVDYVEYDTIYKLPIHKNIGTSTYVIESVISDEIDDDLSELYTLKLRNDLNDSTINNNLTYKIFDESIEKPLQVGDELINYNGTGKVKITEIHTSTNTIVVKVINGEYLNFIGTDKYNTAEDTDIHDMSKLRFHSTIDFDTDKVLKLPLEEDQYIFVAVAPVNSRLNIQSSWGNGLVINTFALTNNDIAFNTYYNENVKNIGDVLHEMTSVIASPITSVSHDNFNTITNLKPVIDSNALQVTQINKHLNNSTTVKNIRNAYDQKKNAETSLSEVQNQINDINEKLASISFDDVNGVRATYTAQLTTLNNQKNELLKVINNAINTISINVNSAEIPIENAKYRIRGFYTPNLDNTLIKDINEHVIGIQVHYRYKNLSSEIGNATSMNNSNDSTTYIYSDWNVLNTKNKNRIVSIKNGNYSYEYEANNETVNEPSYNQIDIPISQGESVDIRIKVIYDYGQPYTTVSSKWSDIATIQFPSEFVKDVPILTIIEENNNDIETNRFNTILENSGINSHINDMIVDQNITFYHKPDHIASGFYTEERKIIPLKDKLQSISNDIATIKSDVLGTYSNFKVSILSGDTGTEIYSDRDNDITLEPYENIINNNVNNVGVYKVNSGVVSTILNISIANVGESIMKIYSLFPGNRDISVNNTKTKVVSAEDYCGDGENGVWYKYISAKDENDSRLQSQNQFITFRIKDAWTGNNIENASTSKLPVLSGLGIIAYPYLNTKYGLCMDTNSVQSYIALNPGEELIVPIYCEYKLDSETTNEASKTMSFDIRTSLYKEHTTYSFNINVKNTNTVYDDLMIANKKQVQNRTTTLNKYNQTIK